MLRAVRYFVIVFAILTQAVLAVLGIGNLLTHMPASVFTTVNACVAVSGTASAVFMLIVVVLEISQKEQTTTNALFEIVWVALIWIITTLEASWLSTADVLGCDVPYTPTSGVWDVCFSHRIGIPIAWAAALFSTAHLILVIMLVEWHRAKSPPTTLPQPFNPRFSLQRFWKTVVKPEVNVLAPILSKSVYVLITERTDPRIQTRRYYDRRQTFMNRVSRAFQNPSTEKTQDDRIKLQWQDEEQQNGEETWTGSYYFQNHETSATQAPLVAPLPVFAPTLRLADIPRYQLHDAPVPHIPSPELLNTPVMEPRIVTSTHSRTPSTSSQRPLQRGYVRPPPNSPIAPRRLPLGSPQLLASPSSPRLPTRARTLPSTPPRAWVHGAASPAPGGPLLTRSATIGGARRFDIPARYRDLDWTIPQEVRASFAAPLPPPGFLPRPNARY